MMEYTTNYMQKPRQSKEKPVPQCPTVRFCGRTSFMLSRSPLCASAPDSPLPRDRRIHRGGPTSTAHSAPLLFPIIHQITPELRNNGGSEVSFPTSLTHIEGFSCLPRAFLHGRH